MLPFCINFLQGFLACSSSKTAEESLRTRKKKQESVYHHKNLILQSNTPSLQ